MKWMKKDEKGGLNRSPREVAQIYQNLVVQYNQYVNCCSNYQVEFEPLIPDYILRYQFDSCRNKTSNQATSDSVSDSIFHVYIVPDSAVPIQKSTRLKIYVAPLRVRLLGNESTKEDREKNFVLSIQFNRFPFPQINSKQFGGKFIFAYKLPSFLLNLLYLTWHPDT